MGQTIAFLFFYHVVAQKKKTKKKNYDIMNKKILRTEGCKPTTPTSIFRRWCVAAIILCFTMSANAQTDTNNGGVFHGLNDLTGKTLDELIQKATDATTFSMEDPDKVFFLYNLETKQFLNSGSYWGTHVSLKYYGLPLWVVKVNTDNDRINFAQNLKTGIEIGRAHV